MQYVSLKLAQSRAITKIGPNVENSEFSTFPFCYQQVSLLHTEQRDEEIAYENSELQTTEQSGHRLGSFHHFQSVIKHGNQFYIEGTNSGHGAL